MAGKGEIVTPLYALAFLSGVLALGWMSDLPSFAVYVAVSVAVLAGLRILVRRRTPALLLLWVILGFGWALLRAGGVLAGEWPAQDMHRDVVLTGVVIGVPERNTRSTRFEFAVESALLDGRRVEHPPGYARLSWFGPRPMLHPGERWRLTARLKPPHGYMNPGGFDYEEWLFSRGIRATGYVRDPATAVRLGETSGVKVSVDRMRQWLNRRLHAVLGDDGNAGVIAALVLGLRGDIPEERWRILLQTGTNHLIAISGLHIGLIAGLVFALMRRIWGAIPVLALRVSAHQGAAVAALFAAAGYALLAGFSIPTQRALVMLLVVMGGVLLKRRVRPFQSLSLALTAVLLFDPFAVHNAGFWLSFAAVGFILYAVVGRRHGASPFAWKDWGRVQWALAVGLLPLSVALFQRAAPVAPLANLLAVPWIAMLVLPLALIGTLGLAVWPSVASAVLHLTAWLLGFMWPALEWLSRLPGAHWRLGLGASWVLPLALLGAIVVLAPRAWPARWVGWVLIAPLLLPASAAPEPGAWRLTALDVGQGLALTVRTAHHVLVYDAGPRYGPRFDAGEAIVGPFLRTQGITRIDRLVVSHPDMDHRGGVASLLAAFNVSETTGPQGPHACRAGQNWRWDGVVFAFLGPDDSTGGKRNDRSCVLRISGTGGSALLLSDVEKSGEQGLLAHAPGRLAADVVLVPHHGSRTSSSTELVAAVSPRIALVSSGFGNRYGFPDPDVLQRYRAVGADIYDTADSGAISVDFPAQAGGTLRVDSYRRSHAGFWHYKSDTDAAVRQPVKKYRVMD